MRNNKEFGSTKGFFRAVLLIALRKYVVLDIKLEIAPEQQNLWIPNELEKQLGHQECHFSGPFCVMKFTVRKSGIQREKSGYCGQGEKSQFKLHVNSC
jgi:hypothetical protein